MAATMRIGNLQLDAPFYQAGLAGYSDAAMRAIARRHGCPYCVSEALLDVLLINGGKGRAIAELDDDDHPTAGQIMGSQPDTVAAGARILAGMGYDVIDVNLACPVKKIRRKARGGHLLSEPDQAIAILDAVRQAIGDDRPCTVKLRRAYDDTPQAEANFHRIFEAVLDLGYAGATVHGRTVRQKYIGPSKWPALRDIAQRYRLGAFGDGSRAFTLCGSGDIWSAGDIARMRRECGVDGVSVARGCIGNPWIFHQAQALLAGDEQAGRRPPSIAEQRDVLLAHFERSVALHGEMKAGRLMRKFGIMFSRHHPDGEAVRASFIAVTSLRDWRAVLDEHYAADGPGVVACLKPEGNGADETCRVEGAA